MSARQTLLGALFIDSAGELTVESLSAEAWRTPLGGCQWTSTHNVALRP
jgi:hypothetical protein